MKTGLVLSGGGARAAYQVGVLRAVSNILKEAGWSHRTNPFPIICGTSAGAINATALACSALNFAFGLRHLEHIWSTLRVEQIYYTSLPAMMRSGVTWLSFLVLGGVLRRLVNAVPTSLLDNAPLAALLNKMIDFSGISLSLQSGALDALAVTASSYTSGMHLTFYQTLASIDPWIRSQRLAQPDVITMSHLLASAALPFLFPAVPLLWNSRLEYCGDGSIRQLAPISPAIHLGAEKILVVGAGRMFETKQVMPSTLSYPSIAQIAGHVMSSIFMDGLAVDIERISRINRTLSLLPPDVLGKTTLKPVKVLLIAPSKSIEEIASRHVASLPRPIRMMFGRIGATRTSGSALVSYLLFESSFTQELIRLGIHDTMHLKKDVLAFFEDKEVS